jgi:hypothetical protein
MNIYYIDQIVGDAVDAIIIMGEKKEQKAIFIMHRQLCKALLLIAICPVYRNCHTLMEH